MRAGGSPPSPDGDQSSRVTRLFLIHMRFVASGPNPLVCEAFANSCASLHSEPRTVDHTIICPPGVLMA